MYKNILSSSYTQIRQKYQKFESINSVRKIITFKNDETLDSYSRLSDVVVYYDVISDSTPLLLVERLQRCDVRMFHLKMVVRKLNKELIGYVASVEQSDDNTFVDIVVVKSNIYNSLSEGM